MDGGQGGKLGEGGRSPLIRGSSSEWRTTDLREIVPFSLSVKVPSEKGGRMRGVY